MQKRDRQRFIHQAVELIESLGAVSDRKHQNNSHPCGDSYHLDTICGPLWLRIDRDQPTGIGSVYTRFSNPEEAIALTECNPFSGKWNHYYYDNWSSVENAIKDLTHQLRRIIRWRSITH